MSRGHGDRPVSVALFDGPSERGRESLCDYRTSQASSYWYHYDTIVSRDSIMPNVLVRDLDDDVLKQLKAAAKANRRSLQAEIHDVLRRANTRNLAETRRLSSKWLKRLGRSEHSDSAALIREDRDAR